MKANMRALLGCKKQNVIEAVRYHLGNFENFGVHFDLIRDTDTEFEFASELEKLEYDYAFLDYDFVQISGWRFVKDLTRNGALPKILYVIGPEAVSSYESELIALSSSNRQIIPTIDFRGAVKHCLSGLTGYVE